MGLVSAEATLRLRVDGGAGGTTASVEVDGTRLSLAEERVTLGDMRIWIEGWRWRRRETVSKLELEVDGSRVAARLRSRQVRKRIADQNSGSTGQKEDGGDWRVRTWTKEKTLLMPGARGAACPFHKHSAGLHHLGRERWQSQRYQSLSHRMISRAGWTAAELVRARAGAGWIDGRWQAATDGGQTATRGI